MDVKVFAHQGKVAELAINGEPVDRLVMTRFGPEGDKHAERSGQYVPRHGEPWQAWWEGMPDKPVMFDWRSWVAISLEDRARLAQLLDMGEIRTGGLWENFVFSGIPHFSKLPPGARLCIFNAEEVQVCQLMVVDQNFPCSKTAKHLHQTHGLTRTSFTPDFREHAKNLRGVMGFVTYPGEPAARATILPGYDVRVWLPVNAHHVIA